MFQSQRLLNPTNTGNTQCSLERTHREQMSFDVCVVVGLSPMQSGWVVRSLRLIKLLAIEPVITQRHTQSGGIGVYGGVNRRVVVLKSLIFKVVQRHGR